jgi:hypothetical protein
VRYRRANSSDGSASSSHKPRRSRVPDSRSGPLRTSSVECARRVAGRRFLTAQVRSSAVLCASSDAIFVVLLPCGLSCLFGRVGQRRPRLERRIGAVPDLYYSRSFDPNHRQLTHNLQTAAQSVDVSGVSTRRSRSSRSRGGDPSARLPAAPGRGGSDMAGGSRDQQRSGVPQGVGGCARR